MEDYFHAIAFDPAAAIRTYSVSDIMGGLPVSQSRATNDKVKCIYCGSPNWESSLMCAQCGAPLPMPLSELRPASMMCGSSDYCSTSEPIAMHLNGAGYLVGGYG